MDTVTEELVKKAASGDLGSFEIIYRKTSGFVYNVAFNIAGSKEAAEDITQNVFICVYDKIKDFQFKSSFKTWLYRVTINMSLNAKRDGAKHIAKRVDYDYVKKTVSISDNPENDVSKDYERDYLLKLIDKLPERQKTCLILRNIQGLSYSEIADTMETNINTVRTWLRRSREVLLEKSVKEAALDEL